MRGFLLTLVGAVAATVCVFISPAPAGNEGANKSPLNAEDQKFVEHVWNIDMTEINLGKIAEKNAASDDVKSFAKHMVDDHSKNIESLNELSKEHNGAFPSAVDKDNQELVDRLSKLTGADFDKEYMTAMVSGHQKAIAMFEAETHGADPAPTAKNPGNQTPTNRWAAANLPSLKEHLRMAEKVGKSVGATLPDAVTASDREEAPKGK